MNDFLKHNHGHLENITYEECKKRKNNKNVSAPENKKVRGSPVKKKKRKIKPEIIETVDEPDISDLVDKIKNILQITPVSKEKAQNKLPPCVWL